MVDAARRRATYDDVLAAPAHLVAELLDGELSLVPRPAMGHTVVASTLGAELGGPFQRGRGGPGGWWILDEPELHLAADVLVPDLAGWRRERLPSVPASAAYLELAPDWVCEVSSPATARLDRVRKLPIYAREGVQHVWLVDPIARTLEVLALERGRWTLLLTASDEAPVRAAPFDAIELDLSALWGDVDPSK